MAQPVIELLRVTVAPNEDAPFGLIASLEAFRCNRLDGQLRLRAESVFCDVIKIALVAISLRQLDFHVVVPVGQVVFEIGQEFSLFLAEPPFKATGQCTGKAESDKYRASEHQ